MEALFRSLEAARVTPVEKGWSEDRKYRVDTASGRHLLVRVSPVGTMEAKRQEFEVMCRVAALDLPMTRPLRMGCLGDGRPYLVLTWAEGEALDEVVGGLEPRAQYHLGLTAGRALRRIHSLPAPPDQPDWALRYNQKIDRKLEGYRACGLRLASGERLMDYIAGHRDLLSGRPQCLHHGDYHVGNLVLSPEGGLSVIDFNRFDYGDPWEEFNRICWCAQASPCFASGRIDGYFEGPPPTGFFECMALYIAVNTLSSIYWAIPFGQQEIDTMREQARQVDEWYDGMRRVRPGWYAAPAGCGPGDGDTRSTGSPSPAKHEGL